MADADLRELQRRAAAGEPGARGALLLARRRVGELTDDALGLAAHVGDLDARQLLGWPGDPQLQDPLASWSQKKGWEVDDRAGWARSIAGWGREAAVRAGIALARLELRIGGRGGLVRSATADRVTIRVENGWGQHVGVEVPAGRDGREERWRYAELTLAERLAASPLVSDVSAALVDTVEQWALCPCPAHAERAARGQGREAGPLERLLASARPGPVLGRMAGDVHKHYPVPAVVRDEVAPWALGERDPVRERLRPAPG